MRILLFSTVALLTFAVPAARAQQDGGKKKKSEDPQFDGGATTKKGEPQREAVTPELALADALPVMVTWPSENGENVLRALIARGPEMTPLLRARLRGGTVLERAASARALCLLGDVESFGEIEKLFADPRQRPRFNRLLESLHDLDPVKTGELALRFLDSEQSALRNAATALVKAHCTPAIVATLKERLIDARSDAVRVDLFSLLLTLKEPELPTIALERFLGDPSSQLAAQVTELLSWQDAPEIRNELIRLATGNRERRGMHAALALALAEQRSGAALLPESLFDAMLPNVRTSDMLMRATSCVVCGMIGYRSEASEARSETTQLQVLPALSDLVVNGRFFGDFELCFKAAVRTLELLTGERLGPSIPKWREFLALHADGADLGVKGRRELGSFVLDEDATVAIVTLATTDAAGGVKSTVTLCGPSHRPMISLGERPGRIALTAEEMRALLAGLEKEDLLKAELPRRLEPPVDDGMVLTVEARGRERVAALAPGEPHTAAFETWIRRAAEPECWQVLLSQGDGYERAFAEEQAWVDTHHDPAVRRSRLLDLALAQIASGDGASAKQAFEVLAHVDALGDSVRATQVDAMATLLGKLPASDPRSKKLFDLLVSTRRADALEKLIAALVPRGPAAVEPIAKALLAFDYIGESVGDVRPVVRVAALTAAASARDRAPSDEVLVELATKDVSDTVRSKALALLARSGSDVAAATLLQVAKSGIGAERAEATRLLGSLQRDDALNALLAAARGSDSALAGAALEGLSLRADDAAAAALEGIVRERGPEDPFGRLALYAIKGLPRELALARLRKLQGEETGAVAREAAYGLADLGEMQGVPTLLADLEDAKTRRRAQTLLTYLFCKDLGTESWRFRSLYESQPLSTHADHFIAALKETGVLVPEGKNLRDRAFVPLLVVAIEDSRWFVRRSALEFLEASTGLSLGTLSVSAGKDEIAEVARRWREATTTQARGDEQR